MSAYITHYREKRDFAYENLRKRYRVPRPQGSFFIFPEADNGDGEDLVKRAINRSVFIIPGEVFSQRKSHLRISFGAPMEALKRGIRILMDL